MCFDPSRSPWDPEPRQRTWWQVVNLKISGQNLWRQSDRRWFWRGRAGRMWTRERKSAPNERGAREEGGRAVGCVGSPWSSPCLRSVGGAGMPRLVCGRWKCINHFWELRYKVPPILAFWLNFDTKQIPSDLICVALLSLLFSGAFMIKFPRGYIWTLWECDAD